MNFTTLKQSLARWVKRSGPSFITDNGGTFTAGSITAVVNSTSVSQIFLTNKSTTMTAFAAKIKSSVSDVLSSSYDSTTNKITIYSKSFILLTITTSQSLTGTMTVSVSTPEFFWLDQNAVRPATPYVAGRISSVSPLNHDFTSKPDTSGETTIRGDREFILYLQAFGPISFQLLSDLRSSLERFLVRESLKSSKITFVEDNGGVRDLSSLFNTQIEQRAALDIRFRSEEEIADAPGCISIINMEEAIFGPDLITITLDTITVP